MVGSGSGTGSGKFDRILMREKGPDPTGSGSATLPVRHLLDPENYWSAVFVGDSWPSSGSIWKIKPDFPSPHISKMATGTSTYISQYLAKLSPNIAGLWIESQISPYESDFYNTDLDPWIRIRITHCTWPPDLLVITTFQNSAINHRSATLAPQFVNWASKLRHPLK